MSESSLSREIDRGKGPEEISVVRQEDQPDLTLPSTDEGNAKTREKLEHIKQEGEQTSDRQKQAEKKSELK